MVRILAILLGLVFILGSIVDAFQTVILPRRATGRFRLTRLFYVATWTPWLRAGEHLSDRKTREQYLSIYGPLSLLSLFVVWAVLLCVGFALLYFGLGTPYADSSRPPGNHPSADLRTDLYVSGTTLTTLGPGDVVPRAQLARTLMFLESGIGLGFVALVVSYVPVLYGAFSRREVSVALLDARAGSPPTAAELLTRHGFDGGQDALIALLAEWERWAADILESHISYPILCYYRSQHDNQSWLSALTAILDACALLITTVEGPASRQAQLTFAMARHAVVDLGHIFRLEAREKLLLEIELTEAKNRLPGPTFTRLCECLGEVQIHLCTDSQAAHNLLAIRQLYEPEVIALSEQLCMSLPNWIADPKPEKAGATDQWRKVNSLRSGTAESILARAGHLSSDSTALNLTTERHD